MKKQTKPLFKNLLIFIISLFLFPSCTFLPSTAPDLQFITTDKILDQVKQKHTNTNTHFSVVIKEFQIDDNTDLGIALSDLYLAILTENSQQSINYLSIKDAIHGKNSNEIFIQLDQNNFDNLEKIDICLVKGIVNSNHSLFIENKWKCKSLALNALSQAKQNIPDFTLEDQSANTPYITLSLIHHF